MPPPDTVLGYRPDGSEVKLGEASAQWGAALDDFLDGKNIRPATEVIAELRARIARRRADKQ